LLIVGYALLYLEELAEEISRDTSKKKHEKDHSVENSQDHHHSFNVNKLKFSNDLMIDFIRVIWKKRYSRRIALFFVANLGFMFVEVLYGYLTNSLGLISDAMHMAFDCLALFVGLTASYLAQLDNKDEYSYGLSRIEVLSGFYNGVFLIFISFKIL